MINKNSKKIEINITYDMIKSPPDIKYIKQLNIDILSDMKFSNEIINFSKILLSQKDIDFSYFYLNIDNLKIHNIGNLIKENARAGYSIIYNSISFKDFFKYYEICHELLHLSSAIFDSKNYIEFCGFSQYDYKTHIKIGTSLNEGYTEYLNEKLFNNFSNTYIIEKNLSIAIEKIIGSTTMKKLFFKANLKGLIDSLLEYNKFDKTIEFIQLLDYVSKNSINLFENKKLDKNFYKVMDKIIDYLIFTYILKLNKDLNNNSISKDEYSENLDLFIDSLGSFDYKFENQNYSMRFISKEKLIKKTNELIKQTKK